MVMLQTFHKLSLLVSRLTPYPPAVQAVITLVLLATPLSAFGMEGFTQPTVRWWAMTGLVGLHLLSVSLVPARRLPTWARLLVLLGQCVLAVAGQILLDTPLHGYLYLTIIMQAIAVLRPWLWISFAVVVWGVWNGGLIAAQYSLPGWIQSNLALIFPATCTIIAVIVYLRQQQRSEQARYLLAQMQQRYDSLTSALRDMQQHVMLEERRRLTQTIASEVQAALARTEQSATTALTQAQSNLNRLQALVAQTRASAGVAIDRLRQSVATLRHGDQPAPIQPRVAAVAAAGAAEESVLSPLSRRVLTWVLPIVFLALALPLTVIEGHPTNNVLLPVLALGLLLLPTYVFTQWVRNPLLLQAGLAGQTFAVVTMSLLTQTIPPLLGLLLVIWQIVERLSLIQILLFLVGVPASLGLLIVNLRLSAITAEGWLICAAAAVAVGGPLLLARRQQQRRHHDELRMALLDAEIEQQTDEVRALAVAAERARMAREFHDDLGSQLVLINLQLQLAEDLAEEDPGVALAQLQTSREQLHTAWRRVLAVADAELSFDNVGLRVALDDLIRHSREITPAQVDLLVEGSLEDLAPPVAWVIYRTVQEGLTNACKHARPSRIGVQIIAVVGYVTITIINDDQPDAHARAFASITSAHGSYGLIGLRERAEALGGGIEALPLGDGGFRLRAVIPAEATL